MGWTIFTAIDLYVCFILLDLMSGSVPPEKLTRLRRAKKVVLASLVASLIILALQLSRRYGLFGIRF